MVIKPEAYLEHYGTGGMHWGIRRYQNPDGSLTEEGRKRYGTPRKRAKLYTRSLRDVTNKERAIMRNDERQNRKLEKLNNKRKAIELAREMDPNLAELDTRYAKKIDKKVRKRQQKIAFNQQMLDVSKKQVENILSDAMMNQYKIKSKDVTRGKNIVNKILNVSPTTVTEYKVKKTRYST